MIFKKFEVTYVHICKLINKVWKDTQQLAWVTF